MKIFSVHDSKAEAYLQPVFYKSTGEAIRAFDTACKDSQSNFSRYPSDFTLVELGMFNETSAMFDLYSQPRILCNASEYAKQSSPISMSDMESRN